MGRKYREYTKVFNNPKVLAKMLEEYRGGATSISLGLKYGVDHTSILHHAKKAGISHKYVPPTPEERLRNRLAREAERRKFRILYTGKGKYDYLLNEPVNQGKNYKEYLMEKKSRSKVERILAEGRKAL